MKMPSRTELVTLVLHVLEWYLLGLLAYMVRSIDACFTDSTNQSVLEFKPGTSFRETGADIRWLT